MSIPIIITLVVCLGIPFLISFRADKPREFRRRAVAIGFVVMLVLAFFLPSNLEGTLAKKDTGSNTDENHLSEESISSGSEGVDWCVVSEIDLDKYIVVDPLNESPTATNYLVTSKGISYPAQNAFDGNITTCWQDGVEGNGEGTEISVSLAEFCEIQYIVIYNGQATNDKKFKENGRVCQLEVSAFNHPTKMVELPDENIPIAIRMDDWGDVSTEITFKIISVYPGSKYSDTCISEIVFYKQENKL